MVHMENDLSHEFLKKYHSLGDKAIEVVTKDGRTLKGMLSGFSRSDASDHTSKISRLYLVPGDHHSITGEDPFGLPDGIAVNGIDIAYVKFSDQSIIKF